MTARRQKKLGTSNLLPLDARRALIAAAGETNPFQRRRAIQEATIAVKTKYPEFFKKGA